MQVTTLEAVLAVARSCGFSDLDVDPSPGKVTIRFVKGSPSSVSGETIDDACQAFLRLALAK